MYTKISFIGPFESEKLTPMLASVKEALLFPNRIIRGVIPLEVFHPDVLQVHLIQLMKRTSVVVFHPDCKLSHIMQLVQVWKEVYPDLKFVVLRGEDDELRDVDDINAVVSSDQLEWTLENLLRLSEEDDDA